MQREKEKAARNDHPTREMPALSSPTRRMERIDPELIALARGDSRVANDSRPTAPPHRLVDADYDTITDEDPFAEEIIDASEAEDGFGGLVPLRDDDCTDWRVVNAKVVMGLEQIIFIPLGQLESLLLVHLDGNTPLAELCTLASASEEEVMAALDGLEWLAITKPV